MNLLVVHDAHPQYASTLHAAGLGTHRTIAVQHHRAHVASVLAERGEWDKRVLGVSFDGTGYGDDGSIWGGEIFVGSVREGFERVAHLRHARFPAVMPRRSTRCRPRRAFWRSWTALPDLTAAPFNFPERFGNAAGAGDQGRADFLHHFDGPAFRYGCGAAWVYARNFF